MSIVGRSRICTICSFRLAEWLGPSACLTQKRLLSSSSFHNRLPAKGPSLKKKFKHGQPILHPGIGKYDGLKSGLSIEGGTDGTESQPHRTKEQHGSPRRRGSRRPERPELPTGRGRDKMYKKPSRGPMQAFSDLVLEQYHSFLRQFINWHRSKSQVKVWGITSKRALDRRLAQFRNEIQDACDQAILSKKATKEDNPLFYRLRQSFVKHDLGGLRAEIRHAFINFAVGHKFTKEEEMAQKAVADLRYPIEWYPATRALQRKIHLHVGPTNSGKTYNALKRLEAAESGIYAGPLRLLAHEIYSRFNALGKSCALITGEERRFPEGHDTRKTFSSCTVEMVPLNRRVEVAVIDEIQMIGNDSRGWAWTQALLGVQADEVHLCGELRTVSIIEDLCAAMGDKLEVHYYDRLSPLKSSPISLQGDLKNLQKGDAIILFSRIGLHAMKREVEKATGKRCAIVYGSLPPETRAQQAALFNDPDNDYDFLVASDAVGMGLNLSIKRIVFESISKHDGRNMRVMETSEIKQIGGRAGRFRTARQAIVAANEEIISTDPQAQLPPPPPQDEEENVGLVTCLEEYDLPFVKAAMAREAEPIKTAGIFPPASVMAQFASYFPKETPFSYILLRLHEIANLHPRYHLCDLGLHVDVSDLIDEFNLTIADQLVFLSAPISLRDVGFHAVVKAFARCVAEQSSGDLLDIPEVDLEILDYSPNRQDALDSKLYLESLESLHKALTLYLWLSYRFAGIFRSQALAFHVKSLAEAKIDECLDSLNYNIVADRKVRSGKMRARMQRRQGLIGDESERQVEAGEEERDADTDEGAILEGDQNLGHHQIPIGGTWENAEGDKKDPHAYV
ncbi:P-loop containing nucleoside triphosphate hydrolase protein [Xylogone sp. PMI_703]|nr:P-loop containing nucleoside triphosphate hydrolase protein [Xylogone sp. PMI_703]